MGHEYARNVADMVLSRGMASKRRRNINSGLPNAQRMLSIGSDNQHQWETKPKELVFAETHPLHTGEPDIYTGVLPLVDGTDPDAFEAEHVLAGQAVAGEPYKDGVDRKIAVQVSGMTTLVNLSNKRINGGDYVRWRAPTRGEAIAFRNKFKTYRTQPIVEPVRLGDMERELAPVFLNIMHKHGFQNVDIATAESLVREMNRPYTQWNRRVFAKATTTATPYTTFEAKLINAAYPPV